MKIKLGVITFKRWPALILLTLAVTTVANCASPGMFGNIDFELTGAVLDNETKQPIEGAYVVAVYKKRVAGPAAIFSYCFKTKGMYTAQDGRFHFPVEKLDGYSPYSVDAIKPGFFFVRPVYPKPAVWRQQGPEAYTGRDIYLAKQDPAKPSFKLSGINVHCTHADTPVDTAAAREFLKIELTEFTRLGADRQDLERLDYFIQRMASPDQTQGRD